MGEWMQQGCEQCRTGVLSGKWSPPYLVNTNLSAHARLHYCTECGAWWEEDEREAHVIPEPEARTTFSEYFSTPKPVPEGLSAYYASGKPMVCELDAQPFLCEFWSVGELVAWNAAYEVAKYAPAYIAFATSGGGEMFAISPSGAVVRLPFVGMGASEARTIAESWPAFEGMLRNAL